MLSVFVSTTGLAASDSIQLQILAASMLQRVRRLHRGLGPVRPMTGDLGWEEAADVDEDEEGSVEAADGDGDGER